MALSTAGLAFVVGATPAVPAALGTSSSKATTIKTVAASKPYWRDLTSEQQSTLSPLAACWDGLPEMQKRKWLVISRNQVKLSIAERAVQHSRMTEWASLSRQEREQARFNFDEVKHVPSAERKAKWEAYQALSDDEKRRLAESAVKRPQGAARTIRPVPAQKLAPVPISRIGGRPGPRIELSPAASAIASTPASTPSAARISPANPAQEDLPAAVAPAAVAPLLSN